MPRRLIFWSIIGTGISSISVQLVIIRELLTQFQGNEMTISVAVFSWLLLTGIGSFSEKLIKSSSITAYSLLTFFVVILPLPLMVMIRHLREAVFTHGVSPGFYNIFIFILAAMAGYCILSGFILPWSLRVLKANGYDSTSGDIYIADNIGDISGGIIFSFILVYWATPFQAIAMTSAPPLFAALMLMYVRGKRILLTAALILATGFYILCLNPGFEASSLAGQYGEILRYIESPYGRIVITKEGSQHTFWESGLPLYSDENVMESEESIHYPLSQLKSIDNLLIVSGGLGETLDEAEKHHPGHIDYVELDPYLTEAAVDLGLLKKKPFIDIINTDARSYLKRTSKKYDAIIINLPDPDTFQINRFFTGEFFTLGKDVLVKDGIFSFGLEYSENYVSNIMRKKLSSMYNTARSMFKNVEIIPGTRAYFICGDRDISLDIPGLLKDKSISTTYIDGFYLGNVTKDRIEKIKSAIDREEDLNLDFKPRMIKIIFNEWFSQYDTSPRLFIIILSAMIIAYLFFIKREEYVLFSTGIAVMGTEMLVLFTFQVIYGYIYLKIGAVVTAFLLGLLPGASLGRALENKNRSILMASEGVLLVLLLFFFGWEMFFRVEVSQILFFLYCFLFSFFCGFQFPVITGILGEGSQPIARCLAADFAGAAVGTIIVGSFLIPSFGIQAAIVFLILIKLSSSVILLLSQRKGIGYN
jgi:spermidine synthase